MISLLNMLWGYTGSVGMQEWSLGRILGIRLVAGWGSSTGGASKILVTPNDGLMN
jgi:hypothetical protein